MGDGIHVEQKAGIGSQTTQIGNQNNYYGLSPQEACNMTMQLFCDNFPKLQETASKVALERVNELMNEIAQKIERKKLGDMSPFGDPDVQYAVYEAQKNYARFGTKEMLSYLSELIVGRVQNNHTNICLKVSIDKAIELVPMLTSNHLDALSLLCITCKVQSRKVRTITDLKEYLNKIYVTFRKADLASIPYLNMLGCLELYLHDPVEQYAKIYGFDKDLVNMVCPDLIKRTYGDFTTSHVGTVLALTNAGIKWNKEYTLSNWIY